VDTYRTFCLAPTREVSAIFDAAAEFQKI